MMRMKKTAVGGVREKGGSPIGCKARPDQPRIQMTFYTFSRKRVQAF